MGNALRTVVFLTGTRADFGKMKALMSELARDPDFQVHVIATGMHMLPEYGLTVNEVRDTRIGELHSFVNQREGDEQDVVLSKTIVGLSDLLRIIEPDLLVVHGDRIEALAASCVGMLNGILVAHIEGGEVSGTNDEILRHAITKISHAHFPANDESRQRILQLGEHPDSVYVIGSPDIDIMESPNLPSIVEVSEYYELPEGEYAICIIHPWTSDRDVIRAQVAHLVDWIASNKNHNFVLIRPNNDPASSVIRDELSRLNGAGHVRMFPSIRFEYFLVLLRNACFIIGNSSAGVREAPHFGVPAINLGSRQKNRVKSDLVINIDVISAAAVTDAVRAALDIPRIGQDNFGDGQSAILFAQILRSESFWLTPKEKHFFQL